MRSEDWKEVKSDLIFNTYVMKVVGGWLVRTAFYDVGVSSRAVSATCVFLPDPEHMMQWEEL